MEDYQRFGVNVVEGNCIVDMVEKSETPISRLAQVGLYYLKDGASFMGYLSMVLHDSILGDSIQLTGSTRRMNIGDHSIIDMQG